MSRLAATLLASTLPCAAGGLLIVGLDGFRHDYAARFPAPHLRRMAAEGAVARALIPCFPSTTFPNFYTIATGLPPEQHGIVEMLFHDPAGRRFYYRDPSSTDDGAWYGGTPIWVAAEKAGIPSATYFWPGSSAEIEGRRPRWFFPYDPSVTPERKIDQVQSWLAMPERERPRLVMVYLPEVDVAGHRHGPDAPQTRDAVAAVDSAVGRLRALSSAAGYDIVVVSDHGMSRVREIIDLSGLADFSGFRVANGLMLVQLYSSDPALIGRTRSALRGRSTKWSVYRRSEIPRHLRFNLNPRIGDLVIVPNGPYLIGIGHEIPRLAGMHGYDPRRFPEMNGVLYAAGPRIRPGIRWPAVRNTDLFRWFARLLELPGHQTVAGPLGAALR